jgi:hypothetical protein
VATGMTKAQQEVTVGEGFAVGCLLIGVTRLTDSKLPLESAFRRAWPRWTPAGNFPVVHATLERTDIWRLLLRHDQRTSAYLATWVPEQNSLYPEVRGSWEVAEAADVIAEQSGVRVAGWVDLAEAFVSYLKPDEFSRSQG